MPTSPQTIAWLQDQLADLPGITTRRMFGEYCVYLHGKPVGFVCDDQLFIKPVQPPLAFFQDIKQGQAYPGSKLYHQIDQDAWEDREWLCTALRITFEALPALKPKKTAKDKKKG